MQTIDALICPRWTIRVEPSVVAEQGLALAIDAGSGGTFQVGPDNGFLHRIEMNIADMKASGANLSLGGLSVSSLSSAQSAIAPIDLAIDKVVRSRGDLGAIQNRLSFSIRATAVMLENSQAADSSIRDADVASEVSSFARAQILTQSGLAAFAQANIVSASALSLL